MNKRILSAMVLLISAASLSADVEVKFNPIGIIFGQIPVSVEAILGEKGAIGIEAMGSYKYPMDQAAFSESDSDSDYDSDSQRSSKATGLSATGLVKLYFNPDRGGDGYYFFPYVHYVAYKSEFKDDTYGDIEVNYSAFGAGVGAGWKFVGEPGLLIDVGAGFGRNFISNYEYSDEDYDEEFFFPFNFIARISVGYRF